MHGPDCWPSPAPARHPNKRLGAPYPGAAFTLADPWSAVPLTQSSSTLSSSAVSICDPTRRSRLPILVTVGRGTETRMQGATPGQLLPRQESRRRSPTAAAGCPIQCSPAIASAGMLDPRHTRWMPRPAQRPMKGGGPESRQQEQHPDFLNRDATACAANVDEPPVRPGGSHATSMLPFGDDARPL